MANSKRKTYAVYGMMEWYAVIKMGASKMTVPFTGGSLSGYGVSPAKFTTEHPLTQAVIEHSDYYKSGRIVLLRESEGSGRYKLRELPVGHAPAGTQLPGQAATASMVMDSALNPNGRTEKLGERGALGTGAAGGYTEVTVTDIEDARDYLVEHCGVARSTIRSMVSVKRSAEEHRVVFVGLEE